MKLWRQQEWHDWFRWRLTRAGRDWSKPIWFGTLAAGLALLTFYGARTGRWEITAGGVVAWFAAVNLGLFAYFGLRVPGPPLPVPGPFPSGQRVRARMGLYPPGYDGRKLARIWLRVPASSSPEAADGATAEWLVELACPSGWAPELAALAKRQETFRLQRGDAPSVSAVCETQPVTREELDAGAAPLRVVAWRWDESSAVTFGRPAS